MTREEAYCQQILLMSGFTDPYRAWLDHLLEQEEPLSAVTICLTDCGDDRKKILSVLHNYCISGPLDTHAVHERLRLWLREAYHTGKMSKAEVVSAMYRFSCQHYDTAGEMWTDMDRLSDYYYLVTNHLTDAVEQFDAVFLPFLNEGTPVGDTFWSAWLTGG